VSVAGVVVVGGGGVSVVGDRVGVGRVGSGPTIRTTFCFPVAEPKSYTILY
jgi:hypothetical protein